MAPETPKGVSSRLLTMKFMQRAAASANSTPGSESEGHSSKKRKLAHQDAIDKHSAHIDQALFQAANEERDAARKAALERHASAADTFWTLDSAWTQQPKKAAILNVVHVGYGDLASSDDEEDNPQVARTSTSAYKKTTKVNFGKEVGQSQGESSEDNSDDDDEDDGKLRKRKPKTYVSGDGSKKAPRGERRLGPTSEDSRAAELRKERKKKEVKLNRITSISNASEGSAAQNSSKAITCYNCQKVGHRASDCPKSRGRTKRG